MDPLLASFGLSLSGPGLAWLADECYGFAGAGPGHEDPHQATVSLSVCGVNQVLDLQGDIIDPDLVLFWGGSQFMLVPELVRTFQGVFPRYQRVFFETLPTGILEQQVRTGRLTIGNLRIQIEPDVMACGQTCIRRLNQAEDWFGELTAYTSNRLVLMVRQGNPRRIESWADLSRDDVRVSLPDPRTEGIAEEVLGILRSVGGDPLADKIMKRKVRDGSAFLCQIHHRQTPLRILHNQSDVGPAWHTEVLLQRQIGNPIEGVVLPEAQSGLSTAVAAGFRDSPHPQAVKDFLFFLRSSEAERIYRRFGFLPLDPRQQAASV